VAAVSRSGQCRAEAWQRGSALESGQAGKTAAASAALDCQKIFWWGTKRFGPTLTAEHLAEEDGIVLDHETLRR